MAHHPNETGVSRITCFYFYDSGVADKTICLSDLSLIEPDSIDFLRHDNGRERTFGAALLRTINQFEK